MTGTPSVAIQGNTETTSSEWRFRRSGHISGLDKRNRNVLRGPNGTRYSQVGAAVRAGRNRPVTPLGTRHAGAKHPYMSVSK
ncbi:hypothetical protein SGM_1465 [Streptomyces griseoaurantiacus M045]|uniref:Uncharacterized protein n=1 Tax=Streptomyces griseoaurantiacus M045 TaxID=996637 RepID=F3NEA1_9ACTN|nr:hypothetical protein SGM_1465 [Streptomyces griseoaurantiacus M045]